MLIKCKGRLVKLMPFDQEFFPPKFARSVSHLTDQEIYLEDSSGRRWRATVCNHNGSLAILQGWPKFSSEHGLNVGDFLVFHYIQGRHFIVQIFGISACEKIKFCSDISKGKKRGRTYPEATSPGKLLQTTDINSVKKKNKTSAASESEKVTDNPNTTKSATNIDTDTGKGSSIHSAIYVDESFCMVDRDAQYDQGDNRLCLHLSSFEMPASEPLAEGTGSLLKVDTGNSNHVETNLGSQTEPHLDVEIDNLNSEALLPKFEAGIKGTDMLSRPAEDIPPLGPEVEKSKEASQLGSEGSAEARFCLRYVDIDISLELAQMQSQVTLRFHKAQLSREARLVKKEFEETAAEAFCPVRQLSGETSANGNEEVIKSESADSEDTPFLNAVSYSLQLEVDGRDFLVTPCLYHSFRHFGGLQ
ncbi:hypothetical protein RND71_029935 [Anisodus tanguticus]|uniref:TF-B3 domain-containing protein n=1 Tax=Anisodus tanguticus TaxID=243964 RepID=A0AAE1RGS1_9SOLA|nr:hypothetical protein RND71_029935 [Anisodus tanguticus]